MIQKNGEQLSDIDQWFRLAGPKSAVQWKDGRSAKESARFWLRYAPDFPSPIAELLLQHPDFDPLEEWSAEPEAQVRFDDERGEPPNLDVLIRGRDARGPLMIAVEAKADESFGSTLDATRRAAEKRLAANPRSGGLRRLDRLVSSILGMNAIDADTARLRYQLFTATAAALAEAGRMGAGRAVVLVHELVSTETRDAKQAANAEDLDAFVGALSGSAVSVKPGALIGPLSLEGAPLFDEVPRLYVGKVRSNLPNLAIDSPPQR